MDDSQFDSAVDEGGSSDFMPAITKPKGKTAARKASGTSTKAAATKPKAKPKAAPKRPKLDENSTVDEPDSLHDDSLLANTPPKKAKKAPAAAKKRGKPLQENPNDSFDFRDEPYNTPKGKAPANASEKYKMISHLEHIILRPDTYIGSIERTESQMWVFNSETSSMELRDVSYVPGLYKIFDEILVNAADNKHNDKSMNEIRVTIDRETGEISVWNNGKGIPIEIHAEKGMYIPEMIFGHLLSSSNYNDDQQKVTGGRNGYGAKLCNVFSKEFNIETCDSKQKKKYRQTWTNNMSNMEKPKITSYTGQDYTKVTFRPDYAKFKMTGMDDDFEALVKRRIHDMAATCKDVRVSLNGDRIKIKGFKEYMAMYTKAIQAEEGSEESDKKDVIVVDTANERWQIGFAVSDGSFKQVSFVNSISTTLGGTHVKYIADQIVSKLLEHLKKLNKKGVALKAAQIQSHMFLFVNCMIVNPAFTSQTKEQLTTKHTQFGSKYTVPDSFMTKVLKTDVIQNIMSFAEKKADQIMAKSDGSKRARMNNAKLTDANKAGTRDGHQCTLILTEGDSASGLALAGRAVLDPDRIGVFPLRGKLLNVRDASITQISNNQEIQNIKKFMGLQHKKVYEDTKSLRYGHLMIMTDQDHDGSHIKGLLINFFEAQFPSLLKLDNFLNVFITPIVKVWKGDVMNPTHSKVFYTMPEYEAWRLLPGNHVWEHKYYKGLGTSSMEDGEMYFRDLDRHLKEFEPMNEDGKQLIELAFSKKKADARKNWLRDFVPGTYLDMVEKTISYENFVNKELILFSMADNLRSIPSVVDGLKPSQRKVMYTAFKINLKTDRKVVELAGTVSGMTAYPYGETSLQQTIVGLAHDFVGSNNINCLVPSGNFGSRRLGGQDAASPRYIYTRLSPFARRIFHAADEPLLTYHLDDGKRIEPHNYVPVVPLILMNGADGIGTGWSTSIPNYKPDDIVDNLRRRMNGMSKEDMLPMQPWFRGFKGPVEDMGNDRWKFSGIVQQTGNNEVEITELPVRYWTQDFKDKLEDIIKGEKSTPFVKDYSEYNTPTDVHFVIKMDDKHMQGCVEKGLEETFKLTKTMATTNLVAFDGQGRIHKYETVLDIMEEFYHIRLNFYEKRKQNQLDQMQRDLDKLSNQARFVKMIIDGKLVVSKKKKQVLIDELKKLGFKAFPKIADAAKAGETEKTLEAKDKDSDDEGESPETRRDGSAFDYLLGMAIWSLTEERVAKLLRQIGDKEVEIDTLIKLTPKEIWTKDLDDFIAEWHFQIDDAKKRSRKAKASGRRRSAKLGLDAKGGVKRKRKAGDDDDDDDFQVGKKKPAVKSVIDRVKSKQPSALMSYFSKHDPSSSVPSTKAGAEADDDFMDIDNIPEPKIEDDDEFGPPIVAVKKRGKANGVKPKAAPKAAAPNVERAPKIEVSDGEEIEKMFEAVQAQAARATRPGDVPVIRKARAAAKKASYVLSDTDEDADASDEDDLLGDVSMMVKGIGTTSSGEKSVVTTRPLFTQTTARPSSGHGLPRSISKAKQTAAGAIDLDDSDGIDETDYKSLIPVGSPMRPAARRAGDAPRDMDDDDDEADSFNMPPPKAKVLAKKPSIIGQSKAKASKPAPVAPAPPKKMALSPAARAYAAKQAKAAALGTEKPAAPAKAAPAKAAAAKKAAPAPKKAVKKAVVLSDDDEDMGGDDDLANDILDDEEETPPVRNRGRRVVATKKYTFSDDDDEDEDEEEDEEESFADGNESD